MSLSDIEILQIPVASKLHLNIWIMCWITQFEELVKFLLNIEKFSKFLQTTMPLDGQNSS